MNSRSRSTNRAALLILAAAATTLIDAASAQQRPPQYVLAPLQQRGMLYLDIAAPPDTVAQTQPDWDYFAWNSFVALNWPALEVVPNQYRGVPNLGKKFATAANSDLGVWETFKEKREIFNHPATPQNPNAPRQLNWYSPIDYGLLRKGDRTPLKGVRVFHQNSGATTPANAFDETVEVQSQSLEQFYPDGKTPNPIFKSILPVVTPRVWRGPPSAKNPVVYEVKLNYDYFNYVVSSGLNVDNSSPNNPVVMAAMAASIHLPVRTSSHLGLPRQDGPQNPAVLDYRAREIMTRFATINDVYNGKLPPPAPLPPPQGSIQVKAAWIKLGGANAKPSDFPTWHTAVAQNYLSGFDGNPLPSEPTLFGLVGMHIIQRIHSTDPKTPTGNARPTGGTFIYATWEHESIFNSPVAGLLGPAPTYFYSNFFAGQPVEGPPYKGFYPPLTEPAYPVVRRFPVLDKTRQVTAAVHAQIKQQNPNSHWLHYHLVGTQFQAVDLRKLFSAPPPWSPNDPTGIGQPVFLANLAIETNLGLQYFQGQPPLISVIQNFQQPLGSGTSLAFARDNPNTAFNGNGYNMGGCMGCHGVAQSKGYGFSFVLLDGYKGAVTDTQEHFDQPGANP
jgi:hypothetical protein